MATPTKPGTPVPIARAATASAKGWKAAPKTCNCGWCIGTAQSTVRSPYGPIVTYKRIPLRIIGPIGDTSWSEEHQANARAARILRRVDISATDAKEIGRALATGGGPDELAHRVAIALDLAKRGKGPDVAGRKWSIGRWGTCGVFYYYGPERGAAGVAWPGEPGFANTWHWYQRKDQAA